MIDYLAGYLTGVLANISTGALRGRRRGSAPTGGPRSRPKTPPIAWLRLVVVGVILIILATGFVAGVFGLSAAVVAFLPVVALAVLAPGVLRAVAEVLKHLPRSG